MRKTKLLTGLFRCVDCNSEFLFERVPEDRMECPDCGGQDLEGPEPEDPETEEPAGSPARSSQGGGG